MIVPAQEKEDSDGTAKSKYSAKPPKQLKSMFLINEEQKQKDRLKAEEEKKQQEEAARIAVSHKYMYNISINSINTLTSYYISSIYRLYPNQCTCKLLL